MPPLLPLHDKALTRAEAADLLRGLAELVELYPAPAIVVSISPEAAGTPASKPPRKSSKTTPRR